MKFFSKKQRYTLFLFGFLAILGFALAFVSISSNALAVHFLDIGQGDAIFIETPNKRQVLVDGGPVGGHIAEKLSSRLPVYDRTLDFVIATHMDADHIGGLTQVLERYKIGALLIASTNTPSELSRQFFDIAKKHNIPIVLVTRGDRFILDDEVVLDIVSPWAEITRASSENDASIVARLTYKNDSFLLTGDIERRTEYALSSLGSEIDVDVLKIAHHGSNTSSTLHFLNKTSPVLAIIQVGKNRYGHPHPAVMERIKNAGIEVLRNDKNGVISIYSYGDSI